MTKDTSLIPGDRIEKSIFLIHGEKVILDKDLAILYEVSTGNLNKAVNRNLDRFPKDFMFQLTEEEFKNLMFQFGTSSWGGTRKLPRAFTEQGIAMVSSVLSLLVMSDNAGRFVQLRDPVLFAQAYVEYGAVGWPDEVDLAPDARYDEIKKYGGGFRDRSAFHRSQFSVP